MGKVKVKEVNLEQGFPTIDLALSNMVSQLGASKRQGYRAVILIHGYGSSGTGGKIKTAVRSKLREPGLSGLIRVYCGGEEWICRRNEMTGICSQLKDFDVRLSGNPGVTVVILK